MPAILGTLYLTAGAGFSSHCPGDRVGRLPDGVYAKQGPVVVHPGSASTAPGRGALDRLRAPFSACGSFCRVSPVRFLHPSQGRSHPGDPDPADVIGPPEEALNCAPDVWEASSRWACPGGQTVRIVLCNALPGIPTGSILGIGRRR